MRFVVTRQMKLELEKVRSLLGPRGGSLSLAELISEMARLSTEKLSEKKFGKARAAKDCLASSNPVALKTKNADSSKSAFQTVRPDVGVKPNFRTRYIAPAVKHEVWHKAGGRCAQCKSTKRLQFDHIRPFSLGGESGLDNIQLLCASCNLRRGIVAFGTQAMRRQ